MALDPGFCYAVANEKKLEMTDILFKTISKISTKRKIQAAKLFKNPMKKNKILEDVLVTYINDGNFEKSLEIAKHIRRKLTDKEYVALIEYNMACSNDVAVCMIVEHVLSEIENGNQEREENSSKKISLMSSVSDSGIYDIQ